MKNGSLKKLSLVAAAVLASGTFFSCASAKNEIVAVIPEAKLDLGAMPRDSYIILGQVSGESSLLASPADIERADKNRALDIREYNTYSLIGDTGKYGFVGNVNNNMSVTEKAVALATYKMIDVARYNGADAVVFVNSTVSITKGEGFMADSTVKAKTTGIAVKLKADKGVVIELPPAVIEVAPAPEPESVPAEPETAAEEQTAAAAE
ncbi:MAG: hypothetical protein J6Z17_01510 [Treponema sp.]|nr:hypothetical protein [Treponema sp.]